MCCVITFPQDFSRCLLERNHCRKSENSTFLQSYRNQGLQLVSLVKIVLWLGFQRPVHKVAVQFLAERFVKNQFSPLFWSIIWFWKHILKIVSLLAFLCIPSGSFEHFERIASVFEVYKCRFHQAWTGNCWKTRVLVFFRRAFCFFFRSTLKLISVDHMGGLLLWRSTRMTTVFSSTENWKYSFRHLLQKVPARSRSFCRVSFRFWCAKILNKKLTLAVKNAVSAMVSSAAAFVPRKPGAKYCAPNFFVHFCS